MLNVGSCTVVYNPDDAVLKNLSTYSGKVNICVVVDNSERKNEISKEIEKDDKIIYVSMGGNKGIAAALNKGIEILVKRKVEYVLTMDQDSQFPTSCYDKIIALIEKYKSKYSVVGLNFNKELDTECEEIKEVLYWLTSGNFVNVDNFLEVGGFIDELFIDYVDIEFGYRLFKNGLRIGYLEGYSLEHKIGNPIEIRLFGKKYYAMNHSPIRYYYRYRNSYYLYLNDKSFFRKEFFKEIFVNIPKMLFFEKNRLEKMKMIRKGLTDGKKGELGKYNGENI